MRIKMTLTYNSKELKYTLLELKYYRFRFKLEKCPYFCLLTQ
jgi:hypothetical protein